MSKQEIVESLKKLLYVEETGWVHCGTAHKASFSKTVEASNADDIRKLITRIETDIKNETSTPLNHELILSEEEQELVRDYILEEMEQDEAIPIAIRNEISAFRDRSSR